MQKATQTAMQKKIGIVIGVTLLLYGLLRIGVGSLLLSQHLGWLDVLALQDANRDVGTFLAKSADQQLIAVSVPAYLGYIAVMGLVLAAGAVRTLRDKSLGLRLMAIFLLMYAMLFINFQTVNPKLMHLAVCTVLYVVLCWLKQTPRMTSSTQLSAGSAA